METPLSLAVFGAGRWGRRILSTLERVEHCRVSVVCDTDRARHETLRGYRLAEDSRDVFDDPAHDAIVIATPPATHAPLAERALRAGKHVFVEKPLALRVTDAAALHELARRRGRKLMVGHVLRYHPAVVALQNALADGTLPEMRTALCRRLSVGANAEDAWWSLAPHDISLMVALFGCEPTAVSAVRDSSRALVRATVEFPGERHATILVGHGAPHKVRELVLFRGTTAVVFDDTAPANKLRVTALCGEASSVLGHGAASLDELLHVSGEHFGEHSWSLRHGAGEPLHHELSAFVASIREDRRVPSDGAEGALVVRVLAAGDESAGAGGGRVLLAQAAAA